MLNCSKGSENAQMACALGRDRVIGAAGGASKAGLPGAAVGAGLAAVQNVSLRLLDHGPVNVAIPQVAMKPSHAEQNEDDKSYTNQSDTNNDPMPPLPMNPSWTNRRE